MLHKADFVFLVDSTYSMSAGFDRVRESIKRFFASVRAGNSLDCRARVVGFRDVEADGDDWLIENEFVSDMWDFYQQIDELESRGGSGGAESQLDALYSLCQWGCVGRGEIADAKKWRYRNDAYRFVVLVTDSPFKAKTHLAAAPGLSWMDVANVVMQERLRLSIFAPQMDCYDDLSCLDKCEYMAIPWQAPVLSVAAFMSDKNNCYCAVLSQLNREDTSVCCDPLDYL